MKTIECTEKILMEELGELDDEDREVAKANDNFEETIEKIFSLL